MLKKPSDSDAVISLLSRVAHCVSEERDSEVQSRLLLALGHLILYHHEAAVLLQAMDLSMDEFSKGSEKNARIIADILHIQSHIS